jgi:hypothetical protein
MIAEAIQVANPHYRNVLVDLATIRWSNPRTGKRYICLTPERAGEALVLFDRGEDVEPFTLRLDPIQVVPIGRRHAGDAPSEQLSLTGDKKKRAHPPRARTVDESGRIAGGRPLPAGHLTGGSIGATAPARAKLSSGKSNTEVSRSDVRVFGRRLLKG